MSRRSSLRTARRAPSGEADLFAALGNETRLRLVRRLSSGGPASIARLAAGARVSRQAVTKHLEVLARAGLVHGSKRGREHLWRLAPDRVEEARRWLEAISARWDAALERLRAAVESPASPAVALRAPSLPPGAPETDS